MDRATRHASARLPLTVEQVFPDDSEMARLMRATDWAATPLGSVETWSLSLRMMVNFLLVNRFPLLLWWGQDFLQLYNDPYRPVLGTKHPRSLGQPARECWAEIWDVIGPLVETPFNGGPATWMDDLFLEINRHGFMEETHFTVAYSPVPDETAPNGIGGVLATVHEISDKVIAERRVMVLRDLGARASGAQNAEEACRIAAKTLAQHPRDIPFALLYLLDDDGQHARLAATAGIEQNDLFSPAMLDLGAAPGARAGTSKHEPWPLNEVMRTETMQIVNDLGTCFEVVPPGPWSDPPATAAVMPIRSHTGRHLAGFLVAGVSARIQFDDAYAGFLDLVSSQLATAIANARAYEDERKRAEALAELDRAKTIFFSNVSHEFRTPLTLMLGPLEDLLIDTEDPVSPGQRERLEVMQRNGLRLLKLVNALLDFARIEAGRIQARYAPLDLATVTADLAGAFRSLVEKAGLELRVESPPLTGLSEPVYVDREMWEKIVLNLLSNAFKFTFDGSISVTVRAVRDGKTEAVELAVKDTGTGISAAELPRLFERFHRVDGARSRTYEGSGIGLALVQELVHLHGGTIRVESEEGAGTTFFVRLPVGASHLPADRIMSELWAAPPVFPTVSANAYVEEAGRWLPDGQLDSVSTIDGLASPLVLHETARIPGGKNRAARPARILIADDNADMREYLRRLLSESYTVETAANGKQALEAIFRAGRPLPDLVLADVMMPELDGFALIREVRAHPQTVAMPVMLLSARAGEEATLEGLDAGADDYLVKPFSSREMLSRVAARLEISRTRSESGQRTHRALEAVLHMAQTLFNPLDTPAQSLDGAIGAERQVAHRLATLTCDVLGCKRVGIIAIDPETDAMRAVDVVGLTPKQEAKWWVEQHMMEARGARMGDDGGPAEVARFRAGEIFVVDMTKPPFNAQPNPYRITTSLVAPMRVGERLVGMLSLDFGGSPHTFTDDERALAGAVAQLGAAALEREHLIRSSAEATARQFAAEDARRQMNEFLGIATHELRTPLTSTSANVQMAYKQLDALASSAEADDDLANQHSLAKRLRRVNMLLERTNRQMTRLDRLVGDLIDAARIQAGRLELRIESCDLLAIVREAVQDGRISWPQRTIALTLPRRAVVTVNADADRIGQVVANYLTNALKYSADDAEVVVSVRVDGDDVRLTVRDQGPGLTLQQQEHLFELFYRAPGIELQSGSGVGLGLGLHICKSIVERHGGAVGVASAPGKGSGFWFTLPLANDTE